MKIILDMRTRSELRRVRKPCARCRHYRLMHAHDAACQHWETSPSNFGRGMPLDELFAMSVTACRCTHWVPAFTRWERIQLAVRRRFLAVIRYGGGDAGYSVAGSMIRGAMFAIVASVAVDRADLSIGWHLAAVAAIVIGLSAVADLTQWMHDRADAR